MNETIQEKLETLATQIEAYDINAVVTGEQYEQERRVGTHGNALQVLRDTKHLIARGREIKGSYMRELDYAIESTK